MFYVIKDYQKFIKKTVLNLGYRLISAGNPTLRNASG
jgi:hypothetical protein